MYFKCKQTGNVYFYAYEADILTMKEHPQYECLGEAIPEEPNTLEKPTKPSKKVKE